MAWTSTLMRLALTILLASSAEISAQQQFGAPVALFPLPGSSASGPTFFPVGGDHGWNVASDPALLQKWSAEKLQQIKRGDVLVFTSSPGTQHSVRVSTSTAGDITQGSVSCTSKLAAVDTGTNRFTSNVSLVILQTNVTYVVTSSQRDCQQGLAFFFVVPPDPSQLQTYYAHRDVGVAYNLGYTNAGSESPVTSFGNLVPSQSGAYIYHEPGYSRKFFNGDLLNMELPGAYQVNVYTSDDSPASPSNFEVSTSFKGADNALTYLVTVGLAGGTGKASGFQKYYYITYAGGYSEPNFGNASATAVLADFVVQNVTSQNTCGRNPGVPYVCNGSSFTGYSGTFTGLCIFLALFMLAF